MTLVIMTMAVMMMLFGRGNKNAEHAM